MANFTLFPNGMPESERQHWLTAKKLSAEDLDPETVIVYPGGSDEGELDLCTLDEYRVGATEDEQRSYAWATKEVPFGIDAKEFIMELLEDPPTASAVAELQQLLDNWITKHASDVTMDVIDYTTVITLSDAWWDAQPDEVE